MPSTSPQWVAAFVNIAELIITLLPLSFVNIAELIITLLPLSFVDIAELIITLLPLSFLLLSPPLLSLPPSTTTHTEPEQVAVCVALCIVPQLPGRVRQGPGVLAAPTGW